VSQLAAANLVQISKEGDGKPATKKTLLNESAVGTKEQRKADWAIMKEMAKYLWPKVRPTVS
jgi:ABC transporter ATM